MAAKIVLGLSTYVDAFATGQAAYGRTGDYTQYPTDFDTNFNTLRVTINQIIDELNAVQGPNATLANDIMYFNDPDRSGGTVIDGIIGIGSYKVTVGAPTTQVDVSAGDALVSGTKVSKTGTTSHTGSGGAKTYWIAMQANGTTTLETSAAASGIFDVYSAVWNGTIFTSVTRIATTEVFLDGDDYENMRDRPVETPTWTAKKYDQAHYRFEAIERLLAGLETDGLGVAIGRHVHPDGVAATPGLTFRGTQDLGIYRAGDTMGFSTSAVSAMLLDAEGNLDLTRNARVKGLRTSNQSIADDAAAHIINFNASDAFDIGAGTDNWHNDAGGSPGDQQFTVPTDCAGTYCIVADYEWAAPTNATDYIIEVTVDATADPSKIEDTIAAGTVRQGQLIIYRTLAVAEVVRMQATQDDTGGSAALNIERASLSIFKVA